ncbi:MAG: type I restriction endonuclease subunit R [Chthoniobacterales bacterium]|nr:type I restriction endonuclease subunit R [Chthoniobacterales bacterium]
MVTGINSEDRLVQKTFAEHLEKVLGWDSVYAHKQETFGANGTLGRTDDREIVLTRDLRRALEALNPQLPEIAREQAVEKLTRVDFARSLVQQNKEFHDFIRNGVPMEWRDERNLVHHARARVIDFQNGRAADGTPHNRFLAVRELTIQGLRVPHYRRRADLVCFVNGLPLVFIELKAVYRNMREGFDNNLTDYLSDTSICHAFAHNAFMVVSNGDRARYGSITSKWEHFAEWKRQDESDQGRVDAEVLLNGMLAPARLLDMVENFILFDDSKPGGTRKIVARNHQVLGVNRAVEAVEYQERLKREFPLDRRNVHYPFPEDVQLAAEPTAEAKLAKKDSAKGDKIEALPLVQRAHPDLGRLGVFWHTQGSGKSYSMAMFAEKVRRRVPGNFTFVVMTDRDDLDDQIWRTFVGCGLVDPKTTPRVASGRDLKATLQNNQGFVFTLIHKFNQPVDERDPYSRRDDIIVISDEAHRTQAGKFARNMRLALPNASFIGFTGTPIFRHDHLTRRIFGSYISRYDFQRSVDDGSTRKLIYENRGEKLGIARLDLNDRIAEKIEEAELDTDQTALLEKLLGQDYEVITADDRLDKLAEDFVEHCTERWECGKSMLVCVDKITCARMLQRIKPRWEAKRARVEAMLPDLEAKVAAATDPDETEKLTKELGRRRAQARWLDETLVQIIISEAQNEVRDFAKWDFDIVPHRALIKTGFETPDGKRVEVEDAFKDPDHPFRVAIVCAMWLTGFDVESLQTLYIDKPMKAHTLMQAIARANRVYPGKDCGVIVDYNGMLKSLREALAQYAVGDNEAEENPMPAVPLEEYVPALIEAIEAAEAHLRGLGFEPERLTDAKGFAKIEALRDAVDALRTTDETQRRFEIMARELFSRMKALILEPSARPYYQRHDNIEAIYKKLNEHRDTADVTALLKELHLIVNEAIRAQNVGEDHAEGLTVDLSKIDFEKLREEFAKKARHPHSTLHDIRELVEKKLAAMLERNPLRMDFYKKYQSIIADYNREKDRATVEATFAELLKLAGELDEEAQRHVREGLTEEELAIFDLLRAKKMTKKQRERVKAASKGLLSKIRERIASMPQWSKNAATQADVQMCILDTLYASLPRPPFTEAETEQLAREVYDFVWQQSGRPVAA